MKRDAADALFSHLVRERANWACEWPLCGRVYTPPDTAQLHCSHVYGRRRASTRHHPDNALALCVYHHKYAGENPIEHYEVVVSILGQITFDRLRLTANSTLKLSQRQKEARKRHLKSELDIMLARREMGETGRIDFKAYDGEAEFVPVKTKKKKAQSKWKKKVGGGAVLR